jgi:hypothetical protein
MNLKALARKHTAGGVTWWLMPYATLRNQAVAAEFARIVPRERWDTVQHTFVMLEGAAVDLETDGDDQDALRLRQYWDERPLDLAARWSAFTLLMSDALVDAFWEAYFATREPLIEVDDPEHSAASVPIS